MDEKILNEMMRLAEEFFGTQNDPEQIPITRESAEKLFKLHPKTIVWRLKDGKPISWVVIVPTTRALMEDFVASKISERELLDRTGPREVYEALYLCSGFTVPEYRKHGLVTELFIEAVNAIPCTKDIVFFYWPFSTEGRALAEKLSKKFNVIIYERKEK